METRWLYVTSEELATLRDEARGVCVIPMGCVEKHGLHLPLGTDILEASGITYAASQLETVAVFPDFIFGDVPEDNPGKPLGNITVTLETQMTLLEELCEQIAKCGFKKIMIYNSHGGNFPWLQTFLRKLTNKKRDFVLVIARDEMPVPHDMAEKIKREGPEAVPELTEEDVTLLLKYHEEKMLIGHACMTETAFVMGLHPDAVHLDRLGIESGKSTHEADYLAKAGIFMKDSGWGINYPNAYTGDDPIGCNERIGRAAIRMEAERLAGVFKLYKEDENIWRWHEQEQKGW